MSEHEKATETLYPMECAWGDCGCDSDPHSGGVEFVICATCTNDRPCADTDQPAAAVLWEYAEANGHAPCDCVTCEAARDPEMHRSEGSES